RRRLDEPVEHLKDGGLAGAGAPDEADPRARRDPKAHALEHVRQVRRIPGPDVVEDDLTAARPALLLRDRTGGGQLRLRLEACVAPLTFIRRNVSISIRNTWDLPVAMSPKTQRIEKTETRRAREDQTLVGHDDHRHADREGHERAQDRDADRKPAVYRNQR